MMIFASGFSWFHGLFPELIGNDGLVKAIEGMVGADLPANTSGVILHSWLACGIVLLLAVFARMGLNAASAKTGIDKHFADDNLTSRNAFELITEAWLGLMGDMMPAKHAKTWLPLIASYFCFIFACNIIGIIPGFLPPTDNINTNVGMAVSIFVLFMGIGILGDPIGMVKHMMGGMTSGPIVLLGIFLLGVECISFVIRPVSLTLRLTGNMFGDHMVFTLMSDLTYLVIPSIFLGLAMFVSLIQAFIFSLLSATYIAGSLPHDDDEHH